VETLAGEWNHLVPDPAEFGATWVEVATRMAPRVDRGAPYGDGHAAERVVATLEP
jgi:UDP-N-acetylglucosamine 2-epimerase (non-hydrolysing)